MDLLSFMNRINTHPDICKKFCSVVALVREYESEVTAQLCRKDSDFIHQRILPEIYTVISKLNPLEFDKLQECLLTYVLIDWNHEECFTSIQLVGQIFGYISKMAPKEVCHEYLVLFSENEVPLQIKYFILPEIAKHLKQPVKQLISDSFSCYLLYFMRLKKGTISKSAVAADAKFIRPFWIQIQYMWTNSIALNLLPIFVQMVNIIPHLSEETISEVKTAVKKQFDDQNQVPIYTLLSTSVIILGFRMFEWKVDSTQWEEISKTCQEIFRHCCNNEFNIDFSITRELRRFIVAIMDSFLQNVKVESDDMLHKIFAAIPITECIKNTHGSQINDTNQSFDGIISPENSVGVLLQELERLIDKFKGQELQFNKTERERLRIASKDLTSICQDLKS